ncbi:crotonase/enoyl-CoA hydratase family protein [Sphingomonas sp. 28-63-12]|uniref:crotonase/enoyl-CoA hydratase family protein n=1 Tax=Sphingomonas sp. 28-63-12 TaxID=1970434 RepID=UPI0035A94372
MRHFETITLAVEDGIATITLNRPDRMNAFTGQMMADLIAAFDATDVDEAVRAVIVTGAGRAFCAGADLAGGETTFDYAKRDGGNEEGPVGPDGAVDFGHVAVRDTGGRVALRIFQSLKPVIGAINGAAVGIGATMQLPMDFRLASETARFGFVFAQRGIVPEAASSWFLPRLVGIGQALEWCYSGGVFDAAEALKGGLVRSLHAADDLLPAARALAIALTAHSAPVSVAMTRRMLWTMVGAQHPMDAHRIDSRGVWVRGGSADAKEGVKSFLEKRDAVFTDTVSAQWPLAAEWFDDPGYR